MATYSKASRLTPSAQRNMRITAVHAGDNIDIEDILGRPAYGVRFVLTTGQSITARFNNKITIPKIDNDINSRIIRDIPGSGDTVISLSDQFPLYTITEATEPDILNGLAVSHISLISITPSSGASIQIEVW